MATTYNSLYQRSLEMAAGTAVNRAAYEAMAEQGEMNLAKLQALGKCFKQGWLHNVLARITPLTARATTDYENMATLFITDKAQAELLLAKMSADLSRFATLAGVYMETSGHMAVPMALLPHVSLYQKIAEGLAHTHGARIPAPFASATIDAASQAAMPFVRNFVRQRFAA